VTLSINDPHCLPVHHEVKQTFWRHLEFNVVCGRLVFHNRSSSNCSDSRGIPLQRGGAGEGSYVAICATYLGLAAPYALKMARFLVSKRFHNRRLVKSPQYPYTISWRRVGDVYFTNSKTLTVTCHRHYLLFHILYIHTSIWCIVTWRLKAGII
jgi:hypothetical protein